MANELIDIYDENGNSLGITKLRSEIHKNGDWHKTVHVYVVNPQGQYLIHLRSPFKDLHPSHWGTRFGGHVIAGDDFKKTVIKELKEEIGLDITPNDLIEGQISNYNSANNNEIVKYYFYDFEGDIKDLSFNDNEVVEVKWLSPEEIINSMEKEREIWVGGPDKFKEINDYYKSKK
ncbi:MAG: NUDIX domain-containing protein [Candidatus Falkowbacteria bacterium]|nr:NUDIX domain-containing protein [Candidatus Falkowbacteria bacterium]